MTVSNAELPLLVFAPLVALYGIVIEVSAMRRAQEVLASAPVILPA